MMEFKIDIMEALKNKGFTTYMIRKNRLLSESTLQKLRTKQPVSWDNVEQLCRMLECQPGDILIYKDE